MGKKRRIGFQGGGFDAGKDGGGFGMGVGPDGVGANPSGEGDTGLGGSGYLSSDSGPVTFGEDGQAVTTPGVSANKLGQIQRQTAMEENMAQLAAIESNPNLSMADYNPSTLGGLNPTAGLTFGQSLGYSVGQLGEALGDISPQSIGLGIMGALAGFPGLGFVSDLFGGEEDDDTSVSPTTVSSTTDDVTDDQQSFMDRLSGFFGPADPSLTEPGKGGNGGPSILPPLSAELPEAGATEFTDQLTDDERLAMLYKIPTGGITNLLS